MKRIIQLALFLSFSFLFSCVNESKKEPEMPTNKALLESFEKANRYLTREEEESINDYVRRHKVEMEQTGTGMRYAILKEGTGAPVRRNEQIHIKYETYYITGDLVYTTDKKMIVGKGGIESGLEEAILLMKRGDEAKIILPSHLAFGFLGDQNKIPPRTILVYKLKIIE